MLFQIGMLVVEARPTRAIRNDSQERSGRLCFRNDSFIAQHRQRRSLSASHFLPLRVR
jgi:hypothetical protein